MGGKDAEMKEKWDREKMDRKTKKGRKKIRASETDTDEKKKKKGGELEIRKFKEIPCVECEQNPSLFCMDDLQPVCSSCGSTGNHSTHRLCTLKEAGHNYRGKLEASLKTLLRGVKGAATVFQTCSKSAPYIQFQAQQTEKQIKEEFERLHRFLKEEEESRLAALREEEEKKKKDVEEKMNTMRREMCSLWLIIRASERDMARDESTFMQSYKNTVKRTWQSHGNPEKVCGPLIDVAKHLRNLRYAVWDKMKCVAPYTPVTLDPNTANSYLVLSADLTCVKDRNEGDRYKHRNAVALPNTPERFSCCGEMLGSEGFSFGAHHWVVDVHGNTSWILGVATESVARKQLVPACPESGLWGVSLRSGEYEALESPSVPLSLPPSLPSGATHPPPTLHRLEVCMNRGGGEVSFRDAESGTHLYSYKHSFTERVFPYFYTACGLAPLRLCPETVRVEVDLLSLDEEEEEEEEEEEVEQKQDGKERKDSKEKEEKNTLRLKREEEEEKEEEEADVRRDENPKKWRNEKEIGTERRKGEEDAEWKKRRS